jgi:hypothetical protein
MKPDTKISLINVNGTLSSNGQIIAKAFNNYFISTAQNILTDDFNNTNVSSNSKNPLCYLCNAFNQSFPDIKFKYVSAKEIEDITNSLKKKYSCGYEGISTKILKSSIQYVLFPLAYICNRMISNGTFPMRFKFSEIKPIFKKGDKSSLSDYGPISVLPIIFENF